MFFLSSFERLDVSEFPTASRIDPFELAADDLAGMTQRIKEMLGVDHPVLATVARYSKHECGTVAPLADCADCGYPVIPSASRTGRYFFESDGGKKIRPTMVSLMSRALMPSAPEEVQQQGPNVHCAPRVNVWVNRTHELTSRFHSKTRPASIPAAVGRNHVRAPSPRWFCAALHRRDAV